MKTTTKKTKPSDRQSKPTETGKIVHRLPGRVRVRIDRLHDDIKYGDDLKQAVTGLRGVTEVRINPLASSIVINYSPESLSEQNVLNSLNLTFPIPRATKAPIEQPIADESAAPADTDLVKEAEKFTAEVTSETVGESIGEVVGETVGELLMGPIGLAIGAEIGAKIGGEIGESIEHIVEESIDSQEENPPPDDPTEIKPPADRNRQKPPRRRK
jgi:copper chaperone CopZ